MGTHTGITRPGPASPGAAAWLPTSTNKLSTELSTGSTALRHGADARRAFALRGAYLRLYWIAIIGILGIAYLIFVSTQYPVWMRVEQVLQALVLVGLLIAVSRPQVRNRFTKQQY